MDEEEEKITVPEEPVPEEPVPEEPVPEEPVPEEPVPEEPAPTIKETIDKIVAKYEARIAKLNEEHQREIKQYTDVITEMYAGGEVEGLEPSPLEKINQKRTIRKW